MEIAEATRPLHIVQIGYDDSVFVPEAPSDTRLRQKLYAHLLVEKRPGSRMTVLMLTRHRIYQPVHDDPVTFIPITGRGVLRLLRLLRQLFALDREHKIDVVATQTIFADAWMALAFAAVTQARVVGQIHFDLFSPFAQAENLGGHFNARWRMAIALRLLRYLCVVRVTAQRLQMELFARGLHSIVTILPMPASIPTSSVPMAFRANRPKRVLFVGRLVPQKNLRRWMRVAEHVHREEPEVEFLWAGDGPLRTELLAEAERLGLSAQLHWLGPVPYGQLPAIYSQVTVFLLTSNYEGLPRVVMEAGVQGVPVVSSRVMGVEDIVLDGETGFLHDPEDESGLAASVLRLLRDPDLCARMGAAAQIRVQRDFDLQKWAEQWVELLISTTEPAK